MLHSLCNKGEAELLAVTHCYSSPWYAGCIDAIKRAGFDSQKACKNCGYGRTVCGILAHGHLSRWERERNAGYLGMEYQRQWAACCTDGL